MVVAILVRGREVMLAIFIIICHAGVLDDITC